jgi:hypothetical protein
MDANPPLARRPQGTAGPDAQTETALKCFARQIKVAVPGEPR